MKTIIIATVVALTAPAAAIANDFKASEFVTTFYSGALEFSVGTVDGDLNTVTTGATVAEYTFGRARANVYTSLTYGRLADTLDLTAKYNVSTALSTRLTAYGSAAVSYVTQTSDLGAGDVFVAPTIGASYGVTDQLNVFSDVTYSWNASKNWGRSGGVAELGIVYAVNDALSITPSIMRTFDTAADATNFKLEVGFRF